MKTEEKPLYRRHANTTTCLFIMKAKCLHVDAWLYETLNGLMLYMRYNRAGWQHVADKWYMVADNGALHETQVLWFTREMVTERYINEGKPVLSADAAASMHNRVVELIAIARLGSAATHQSVMLHYIEQPRGDAMEGVINMYDDTGRAGRDLELTRNAPWQLGDLR